MNTQLESPIVVGKPDVKPTTPTHVPGVRQGNQPGRARRDLGITDEGLGALGSARRSTGISPRDREPIDPRSPSLSPA